VPAALLIALPSGLIVSGVATWAARLVSGLAAAGRPAGLILHAAPDGHARLSMPLHPDVRFEDVAVSNTNPRLSITRESWITAYEHAARDLAALAPGHPVILSPNLHADCYAASLEVARRNPALVRLVGWQHNDIEYDRRVLAHYQPALAGIAGVSDHIASRLRTAMPDARITPLPYGVEVPELPPPREPILARSGRPRPIRLLYTGRLDHHQKRILALPHLSRALAGMGIDHELTIMGDGPAAADLAREIDAMTRQAAEAAPEGVPLVRRGFGRRDQCDRGHASIGPERTNREAPSSRGPLAPGVDSPRHGAEPWRSHAGPGHALASIHLTGPATPSQVRAALACHDAFILPSRFEGLSVAMLEAFAAGCVPIVARVASGALQAIADGVNGLIAPVDPDADEPAVGQALAGQVARFLAADTRAMSCAAWATARDRFSIGAHLHAVAAFIDQAAAAPAWPADRPVWFSDPGAAIPADAGHRVDAALARLARRRIAIHGTGLHTRTLLDALLAGPATVVAFTDDDRQRHGQTLAELPIIAPSQAAAAGASDVLLSTHLHEPAVWARREVYERQGLRVHRLYA
jgi:glycosyltransferase involved in cell wall biosynthesis